MLSSTRNPSAIIESFPKELIKPRQQAIYRYILQNNGPDSDRRALANLLKVDYSDLMPALQAAKAQGFCDGIKPYHFQIVRGIWKENQWVDEIVLKQVGSILNGRYEGDFLNFCASVQAKDLLMPLEDNVAGRCYKISVKQPLGAICASSPYLIAMRYLDIIGEREKYAELRPFHFSTASQGTFHESGTVSEVIKRKIKSLLREVYHYDFARLCAQTTREEIMSAFLDPVAGRRMLVSVGTAASQYQQCHYEMLQAYIHSEGLDHEYRNLRPYHLSTATQGTYGDKKMVLEVIVKACKFQIATRYRGDEKAFLKYATIPEIEEPFYEKIAGRRFFLCTKSAIASFGESSTKMKRAYQRHRDSIHINLFI